MALLDHRALEKPTFFGTDIGFKSPLSHLVHPRNICIFCTSLLPRCCTSNDWLPSGRPIDGYSVVPAPAYVLPPGVLPVYPYPPLVAYGPPGYYGGSVAVWGRHYRDRGWHGYRRGRW